MKTKTDGAVGGEAPAVAPPAMEGQSVVRPTVEKKRVARPAVEKIVLTLPQALVERLTEAAQNKGLTRAAYIRMVLTDQMAADSMEEIDRQLYELAKRAEKRRPDIR